MPHWPSTSLPSLHVYSSSPSSLREPGVEDVGASFPHRVTYHPTCHSLRALHLGDAPLRLLRAVRGLELTAILDDKVRTIVESGADVVAAVDTSCLTQIGGGLSRRGLPVRTLHLGRSCRRSGMTSFPKAARVALRDEQLRTNLEIATATIRSKRAAVVRERSDWQELRDAGEAIKRRVLRHLDHYLVQFEAAVQRAGGVWCRAASVSLSRTL